MNISIIVIATYGPLRMRRTASFTSLGLRSIWYSAESNHRLFYIFTFEAGPCRQVKLRRAISENLTIPFPCAFEASNVEKEFA